MPVSRAPAQLEEVRSGCDRTPEKRGVGNFVPFLTCFRRASDHGSLAVLFCALDVSRGLGEGSCGAVAPAPELVPEFPAEEPGWPPRLLSTLTRLEPRCARSCPTPRMDLPRSTTRRRLRTCCRITCPTRRARRACCRGCQRWPSGCPARLRQAGHGLWYRDPPGRRVLGHADSVHGRHLRMGICRAGDRARPDPCQRAVCSGTAAPADCACHGAHRTSRPAG